MDWWLVFSHLACVAMGFVLAVGWGAIEMVASFNREEKQARQVHTDLMSPGEWRTERND